MSVRIYGNREIKTLAGEATRPTSARVREAVFNIWQGRVLGCRWLDLCTGSGAMGAEALCRGAAAVVGIEKSGAACRVVAQNWQKVAKPEQKHRIIKGDVVRQLKGLKGKFDLVYFDPPYAASLYQPVLSIVSELLLPAGEMAVEYGISKWQPAQIPEHLEIVKEKGYGSTHVVFLRPASKQET
ncbi:16S rRNA (guanine(966)-N(2))-methyltransferase RsmD [cf. Phormidesmis sp. LEGE 11477]|uniref:16S rRNA (guanine(966)-N(2))-methyltransferase RsmD n=1 Tax=cf. Phormidesmis sp. LEGE 11477 TaxID=1828680 RepID=UPI00187E73A1|nr:16S rRNA (guanine(966)-N(2))-methyltransferase RsmD [cf. Phormidesmis sp. LEGE 11477]MBE9059555.1 16S rRNA (guanine(966)-N(2))-methyltransferase RsmD [cf. Phormidesmis sp. LEGE 11477]